MRAVGRALESRRHGAAPAVVEAISMRHVTRPTHAFPSLLVALSLLLTAACSSPTEPSPANSAVNDPAGAITPSPQATPASTAKSSVVERDTAADAGDVASSDDDDDSEPTVPAAFAAAAAKTATV